MLYEFICTEDFSSAEYLFNKMPLQLSFNQWTGVWHHNAYSAVLGYPINQSDSMHEIAYAQPREGVI
jgi:hypothetical protein